MNLLPGRIAGPGLAQIEGGHIAFQAGAFNVALGQQVDIGIRPEDLQVSTTGASDKLPFVKDFIEELGATRLIHGAVGGAPMVVAVATSTQADGADGLAVDPVAVHLFDGTTGASLRRASAG